MMLTGARPSIFVLLRIAHVVDREDDDRFDIGLADPLRRNELRELGVRVVGIEVIEIREAVAGRCFRRLCDGGRGQK
jgi:hypothetical protein